MFSQRYESEEGFTLIEILVVILIIGTLSSIAVPVYTNQRKTANDAAAHSDAKNTILAVETYISRTKASKVPITAGAIIPIMRTGTARPVSLGTYIAISGHSEDWCILVENRNSNLKSWNTPKTYLYYSSRKGGWQDTSVMWQGDDCSTTTGQPWSYIHENN